jgi:hypothetical protein
MQFCLRDFSPAIPQSLSPATTLSVGGAEYQDDYTRTPQGWRFASRTVITAAEKAAGLDTGGILAIQGLSGVKLGDHYEADHNGVARSMTSGYRESVSQRRWLRRGL